MKDASRNEMERHRPGIGALRAISHCLHRLFMDRRRGLADEVVEGLTFEELTGALLLGRDAAAGAQRSADVAEQREEAHAPPPPVGTSKAGVHSRFAQRAGVSPTQGF